MSTAPKTESKSSVDFIIPDRATFLRCLDLARPELSAVKQALDRGDVAGASDGFARHFRYMKEWPLQTFIGHNTREGWRTHYVVASPWQPVTYCGRARLPAMITLALIPP